MGGLNNFTSNVNTSTPSVTNTYTNCLFNMAAMAVFTNRFHIQWPWARCQAAKRPIFTAGWRSDSTVHRHVVLGLPAGHFQWCNLTVVVVKCTYEQCLQPFSGNVISWMQSLQPTLQLGLCAATDNMWHRLAFATRADVSCCKASTGFTVLAHEQQ